MRATISTALGAAAVLATVPRAVEQPVSAAVWFAVVALAAFGVLRPRPAIARVAVPAAAVLWLQVAFFPLPTGQWMFGLVLGAIGSLVALGMALIYRANRVLNFAQAELGTAPAVLVVGLVTLSGWPWLVAVPTGLAAAITLGAIVELAIIRRFTRSPRLILTVATIGLSQLLTFVSILLPRLWGVEILEGSLDVPWDIRISDGPPALTGDHLLALLVVPIVIGALAAFIRFTDVGIAIRASAESSDRAALLGVPVRRLETTVWVLATVLGYLGVVLRAGIVSLPVAATLSFGILLTALAAVVLGNLTDLVSVGVAAVAVGLLEQGVLYNEADEMVAPVIGAVIIVAMLVRRLGTGRAEADATSSWRASDELRPTPVELRALTEVRLARYGGLLLLVAGIVAFGLAASPSNQLKGVFVAVFVLVAASIVVLTGWAGQVTLGQMSIVAVGAVLGAKSLVEWDFDLSLAILLSGAGGALVAFVLGLPALRLRGPLLGVTTLAFAIASTQYLLNRSRNTFVNGERFARPRLFATIDLTSQASMYALAMVVAALGLLAVKCLRASRTGRVLLAQRDNDRAAASFGIGVARAKLAAFAVSGFLAGVAGCLYVVALGGYSEQPFEPAVSFNVFTAAVVGGLGSLTGAVLGALFLNGVRWFLPAEWQLLPSAVGVLFVLTALPGGLGELAYRGRDALLRRVADRRGLVVPSLVADVLAEEPDDVAEVVAAAETVPDEVLAGVGAAHDAEDGR